MGLEMELLPLFAPASVEELWPADECLFFEDLMELWWCFFCCWWWSFVNDSGEALEHEIKEIISGVVLHE